MKSQYETLKSVFSAEVWRVIIQVVHVGTVKTYVAPVEALRDKERHDESLQSKLLEKTSLGPSFFFGKIVIPSYKFDAMVLTPYSQDLPNNSNLYCYFSSFLTMKTFESKITSLLNF